MFGNGILKLRESVAADINKRHNVEINPDQVVIVPGGKVTMWHCMLMFGGKGKEILYPVATVILGGVISSTLLDFFVHPALFWLFGLKAAESVVGAGQSEVELTEEHH